jgi:cytidine deaminase
MDKEKRALLIQAAEESREKAYAPYSHFHVGAAVLTEGDTIYTGCNVENASYGLTICGERSAIFTAISQEGPSLRLKAIAVSVSPEAAIASPCGSCRQVIAEFSGPKTVIIYKKDQIYTDVTVGDLLPDQFILQRETI